MPNQRRYSRSRTKTSEELAESLAIPVFYILQEKAQVIFPQSFTAAPSKRVRVRLLTSRVPEGIKAGFPVFVNYKQWRDVIVPILKLGLWDIESGNTDSLFPSGSEMALPEDRGPGTLSPYNPMWSGLTTNLTDKIKRLIKLKADEAGYGNPNL